MFKLCIWNEKLTFKKASLRLCWKYIINCQNTRLDSTKIICIEWAMRSGGIDMKLPTNSNNDYILYYDSNTAYNNIM